MAVIEIIGGDECFRDTARKALALAGHSLVERTNTSLLSDELRKSFDLRIVDVAIPCSSQEQLQLTEHGQACLLLLGEAETTPTIIAAWLSNSSVFGTLVVPVSVPQFQSTVGCALNRAADWRELRRGSQGRRETFANRRTIGIAIGLIMERHLLSEDRAFQAIRKKARSERRKLSDVAIEIEHAFEHLGKEYLDLRA